MKKGIVILILTFVAMVSAGSVNRVEASEKTPVVKLTKEEKQRERERKIAEKATIATELTVREGKRPGYNKLIKSTSYRLMYTEGLEYYNAKRKKKEGNSSGNYQKAQTLLDRAYQSQYFSGTPQEDSLLYYLGCSHYKAGIFEASEQLFDGFRRRFPNSIFIEDVEYMYAMGFYFSSPPPRYDQTNTLRAMIAITEYEGRYPGTAKKTDIDDRMTEMRNKLYTKSYENARLYYTIEQYKAAARALNNAIDEYPESPYREELMYLATKSAYMFAKNSVTKQMTDRYINMMDNYYNLISEYPATTHLKEVGKMRDEAMNHISINTKNDTITPQQDGDEKK